MEQKKIGNYSVLSIAKLYLYQGRLYVPDDFYDELSQNEYSGYRTTSGLYVKIGGSLSREEFEFAKQNGSLDHLEGDVSNLSYEEYLRYREYATVQIYKWSDHPRDIEDKTYFKLDTDQDGNFVLKGQYVDQNGNINPISINDFGIFEQGNYDDMEAVVVQAGGIRLRASICGPNCISGCSFCTFSNESVNYKKGTLNDGKKYYILGLIDSLVTEKRINQLFITGGNPSLDDMEAWTDFVLSSMDVFYASLMNNGMNPSDATVDIMLTPRTADKYVGTREEYHNYILTLKNHAEKYGFQLTLSPNMEIWSQDKLEKYCPSNDYNKGATKSDIGHDGYVTFIEEAVTLLGPFNVRSALIIGLDSIEETQEAIRELVSKGCYVTLSPFMPPECARYGVDLPSKSPSPETVLYLSEYLRQVTLDYLRKLSPEERQSALENMNKCLNAHNTHNTGNIVAGIAPLDREEMAQLLGEKGYLRNSGLSQKTK